MSDKNDTALLDNDTIDLMIDDELGQEDKLFQQKHRGGRPSKMTPQVEMDIVTALNAGNFITVAVEFAGIDRSTFYHWCMMGRKRPRSKYGKFLDKVRHAIRAAEVRNVATLMKAADQGNIDAAKWLLSHKYYQRWGDRGRLELDVAKNPKIILEYSDDWGKSTIETVNKPQLGPVIDVDAEEVKQGSTDKGSEAVRTPDTSSN